MEEPNLATSSAEEPSDEALDKQDEEKTQQQQQQQRRYDEHARPLVQSKEEVVVFENDDDDQPVNDEDEKINEQQQRKKGTGSIDMLLETSSNNSPTAAAHADEGEAEEQQDQDAALESTSTTSAPQQQQPMLLNRFQSWRKHAIVITAAAGGESSAGAVVMEPVRSVQNLWKRRTSSSSWTNLGSSSRINNPEQQEKQGKSPAAAETSARAETSQEPQKPQNSSSSSEDDDASLEEAAEDECDNFQLDEQSFVSGSTTTEENTTAFIRRTNPMLWAASNVADSVNTASSSMSYFRGRYASQQTVPSVPKTTTTTTPVKQPLNQNALIQRSSAAVAEHWEALHANLLPYQYVLLLGRGMLGVNLKQCYSKTNGGVYVDYLVANGAADRSGVVHAGDVVASVGGVDVEKSGTIATVPQIIAGAKPRPVHLILSTSGAFACVLSNHVDIAVAVLHSVAGFRITNRSVTTEKSKQKNAVVEIEQGEVASDDMAIVAQPTSFDEDDEEPQAPVPDVLAGGNDENAHYYFLKKIVNPGAPGAETRQAYAAQAAKRNTDPSFTVDRLLLTLSANATIRIALRNAFLLCCVDERRFPFLERYFQKQNNNNDSHYYAMVLLYRDMLKFVEHYHVTPNHQRRVVVDTIAHKYFLPTFTNDDVLVPPEFDFHSIVADSSLRALEAALKQQQHGIRIDVFVDFQQSVLELLTSAPFLGFMTAPECARMRAYLRNTAPFVNVPLHAVLDEIVVAKGVPHARNYFLYALAYLLCTTEQEGFGENDDLLDLIGGSRGNRIENAASGICAALFIRGRLLPAVEEYQNNKNCSAVVIAAYEQLWENFVAPGVGALEQGSRLNESLNHLVLALRTELEEIQCSSVAENGDETQIAELLVNSKVVDKAKALADELVYDYATNIHPKFQVHKFHEWLCVEIAKASNYESTEDLIPAMPPGCIKRLLRKADFPVGVTPHKPSHMVGSSVDANTAADESSSSITATKLLRSNAECAIVFGTSVESDLALQMPSAAAMEESSNIRRFACQSVALDSEGHEHILLTPEEVPATLESYAVVPASRPNKPFEKYASESWQSDDGWQVSLVNFMIPRADASTEDGEDSSLYGVSLILQQRRNDCAVVIQRENPCTREVGSAASNQSKAVESEDSKTTESVVDTEANSGVSPSSPSTPKKRISDVSWSDRISQQRSDGGACPMIGVALVSQRNVIVAMRETLLQFFCEFSHSPSVGKRTFCKDLVDRLGSFSHQDAEEGALKCVLEPFIRKCSLPWLDLPIGSQKDAFIQLAGHQLIQCLPPIPLALMFVTALLEQKIVLSSSRRSVLFSAAAALSELLKPLKWCHLLVPRVPASLAGDLLQYPAPFILGMPSEDPGIMDLIRELPEDVTLVDLDVGRVILAPSFAHDNELGRGTPNNADTARALRSQVLYLAQSLGNVFGARLDACTWSCDNPIPGMTTSASVHATTSHFDRLRGVCMEFLQELLSGTSSCCYWVEETFTDDDETARNTAAPTVLFDEDRFFHVKNSREKDGFSPLFRSRKNTSELALALSDFDLVLELFLRCQSMNAYIGTRERSEMVFCL